MTTNIRTLIKSNLPASAFQASAKTANDPVFGESVRVLLNAATPVPLENIWCVPDFPVSQLTMAENVHHQARILFNAEVGGFKVLTQNFDDLREMVEGMETPAILVAGIARILPTETGGIRTDICSATHRSAVAVTLNLPTIPMVVAVMSDDQTVDVGWKANGTHGQRNSSDERDAKIMEYYRTGMNEKTIASTVGLTTERVKGILDAKLIETHIRTHALSSHPGMNAVPWTTCAPTLRRFISKKGEWVLVLNDILRLAADANMDGDSLGALAREALRCSGSTSARTLVSRARVRQQGRIQRVAEGRAARKNAGHRLNRTPAETAIQRMDAGINAMALLGTRKKTLAQEFGMSVNALDDALATLAKAKAASASLEAQLKKAKIEALQHELNEALAKEGKSR